MKNRDKTEGQLSVPLSLGDFYCAICIEGQGQIIYLSLSRLVKMTRDRDRDRYIYIYIYLSLTGTGTDEGVVKTPPHICNPVPVKE